MIYLSLPSCIFYSCSDLVSFDTSISIKVISHSHLTCLISKELQPLCLLVLEKVRTLASAGGPDNLVLLDPGKYKAKSRAPGSPAGEGSGSPPKWQIGEQEFEALMRMLDNLVRMWSPLDGTAFILRAQMLGFLELVDGVMKLLFSGSVRMLCLQNHEYVPGQFKF